MTALRTPQEVADLLHISRTKVLRYCAAGKFPHQRYGQEIRFTAAHIDQIQAMHEVQPKDVTEQANPWGLRTRRSA